MAESPGSARPAMRNVYKTEIYALVSYRLVITSSEGAVFKGE